MGEREDPRRFGVRLFIVSPAKRSLGQFHLRGCPWREEPVPRAHSRGLHVEQEATVVVGERAGSLFQASDGPLTCHGAQVSTVRMPTGPRAQGARGVAIRGCSRPTREPFELIPGQCGRFALRCEDGQLAEQRGARCIERRLRDEIVPRRWPVGAVDLDFDDALIG